MKNEEMYKTFTDRLAAWKAQCSLAVGGRCIGCPCDDGSGGGHFDQHKCFKRWLELESIPRERVEPKKVYLKMVLKDMVSFLRKYLGEEPCEGIGQGGDLVTLARGLKTSLEMLQVNGEDDSKKDKALSMCREFFEMAEKSFVGSFEAYLKARDAIKALEKEREV